MGAPKTPSTVTQTNKVELSPEQKQIFGFALPEIGKYASTPTQLFEGSSIAGFDPSETAGQEAALGAADAGGALAGQAGATQSKLLDPEFMLNPNQYLMNAVSSLRSQSNENLFEDVLPKVRSNAIATGGAYADSSRRGLAEGVATGKNAKSLNDAIAGMFLSNYNQGIKGLGEAVDRVPKVQAASLFPAQVMSAVGGQKRGLEQAKLDEQVQKFYAGQDLPLLKAQQLMGLVSGMPGATGTSTVQGAMPQSNPFMQAAGLGMSLLGGFGGGLPGLGTSMMGK